MLVAYRNMVLITVFILSLPLLASAEDWPIQVHRLENGMQVVTLEDHSAPLVAVQLYFHVGSKNESPGSTGFAHFFEHMMFRGTERVGPYEHMELVYSVGGSINAQTGPDLTRYIQVVPANALDLALWLEADRLFGLKFTVEGFEAERETVKEERRRYTEQPYGLVMESLLAAAFRKHPYRWMVIGSIEDLNAARVEDVERFWKIYYVPNNATLVLVGDFDTPEALEKVQKYFGAIKPSSGVPRVTTKEPEQKKEIRVTFYESKGPLQGVVMAYKIPSIRHPDFHPLYLAGLLLSQGQSSRIYKNLVYKKKLAVAAMGVPEFREHPSLFYVFAILNFGRKAEEGEEALQEEIDRLKAELVDERELAKIKNQIRSNAIMGRQSVFAKSTILGQSAILSGNPLLVNSELDMFLAVTREDIQRVAKTFFRPENRTVMYILPESARPKKREKEETVEPGKEGS